MCLLFVLILIGMSVECQTSVDSSYVAAVYEHNVILNPAPHVRLSRTEALRHLHQNLDIYEEQAARAARQARSIAQISYLCKKKIKKNQQQ